MNYKNNRGNSLLSMIVFLFLVGVVGIYGFQIGMGLLEQQTLKGAIKTTLAEVRSNDNITKRDIKTSILKKISINNINIDDSDVVVDKEGKQFIVTVDYTKVIKITEHMKLVMDLNVNETSPQP